jgi:hypothetical protein
MNVGIDTLGTIVAAWVDNEAIVGVHVPRLVSSVVARTKTPSGVAPVVPAIAVRLVVVLGAWGEAEVHKVGNGRLPLAVVEGTHGELMLLAMMTTVSKGRGTYRLGHSILIRLPEALGALVLLLGGLVVAWRGRGATRRACAGATPLLAKEVDGVERRRLDLGRRGRP